MSEINKLNEMALENVAGGSETEDDEYVKKHGLRKTRKSSMKSSKRSGSNTKSIRGRSLD